MKDLLAFKLEKISLYRNELRGIATILILIIHGYECRVNFGILDRIFSKSYIGVELFLLLSGIGMWYSYKKDSGNGTSQFYKKRIVKLLPAYLPIISIFAIWKVIVSNGGMIDYLKYITTISYWEKGIGPWFVALIILLYLVTPIAVRIYRKCNEILATVICMTVTLLFIYACMAIFDNEISEHVRFAIGRSMPFYIGLLIGKVLDEHKDKTVNIIYLYVILILIRYPIMGITPFTSSAFALMIMLLIPMIFMLEVLNCAFMNRVLTSIGMISLESYLVNCCFIELAKYYGWISAFDGTNKDTMAYVLICTVGICVSYVIHYAVGMTIKNRIHKRSYTVNKM